MMRWILGDFNRRHLHLRYATLITLFLHCAFACSATFLCTLPTHSISFLWIEFFFLYVALRARGLSRYVM